MRTSDKTSALCNLTSNLPKKEKHKTKNKDGQNSIKERKRMEEEQMLKVGLSEWKMDLKISK